jgi:carbon storage regulator
VLMIRRRCGESIVLGDDIEIQVLEVSSNRVKIGVSAPRDLLVLRKELRLTEEFNREASRAVHSEHLVSLAASVLQSCPTNPDAALPITTDFFKNS